MHRRRSFVSHITPPRHGTNGIPSTEVTLLIVDFHYILKVDFSLGIKMISQRIANETFFVFLFLNLT